jgi:hypothetical protein
VVLAGFYDSASGGETRYASYRRMLAQLDAQRATWHPVWQDSIDYITPRRGRINVDASQSNIGTQRQGKILNTTATTDAQTLSSGFMVGVTSPARPWFAYESPDEELNEYAPVKRWLEEAARRQANLFRASNLYNVLPGSWLDLGTIGTTALGFLEDDEDVFRFAPFPVGTYYLSNGKRGVVDTCVRILGMTVRQMVAEYGLEQCSANVQSLWTTNKRETWIEVAQFIQPNEDWNPKRLLPKFKRWSSCHLELKSQDDGREVFLRESGFDEMPVLMGRWAVEGENVYGEAPAFDIIPDIKALQTLERRMGQGIDKMTNPALLAPADLASGEVDTRAGAINYYSRNAASGVAQQVVPLYNVNLPIQYVREEIARKEAVIHRGFFADLFLMLTHDARSQPPTAAEIYARQEEKLLALGPAFERVNDEFLDPLVSRGFAIMSRRGLLPPAPPELQGKPLAVRYTSIMAEAQKLAGVTSQERLIGHVASIAPIHPEVLDTIDWDKHVETYADRVGAPAKIVRSAEEIAAIRDQRQRVQAAQQQIAAAQGAARAAKDLSGADLSSDNALTALTGRQPAA